MPIVKVRDLEKSYRKSSWKFWEEHQETKAVKGVSFEVEEGEIFGIVGPNGAGKTTLINMMSGLMYKDSGSIKIFGKESKQHRKELAERMNVSTAYSGLSGNLTVYENLRIFGKIYDVDNIEDKIDEVLEIFQIEDQRNKRIRHMSAGQKTRANLCKSFINDPDVLLLDEASAGLDPHIAEITREAIEELNNRHGTTIIITSHNMEDIDSLSDRMLFLHEGKVLRTGTPEQLKKDIHIKVLEVTVETANEQFRELINHVDGEINGNTGRVRIEKEEDIIRILDRVSDIDATIIDIEAKNPDLNEVFKKVARNEV